VPTGRQDHGVRVDHVPGAVVQVEAVGAEDGVVLDQDLGDVDRVEDRHVQLQRPVDQRALDLQPGVVARERGPAIGVRAEEPLRDPAVALAGERHPVPLQVVDPAGRALGHDPHRDRVREQVALLQGVGRVLLPAVVGIHRGQCRVDPAGRQRRVRVGPRTLAHGKYFDPLLGQLDRGPQARSPGPDHQDRGGELMFSRC
jgi:hypothetical protein